MLILMRAIVCLNCLLWAGYVVGQQPALIVPIGHTDDIMTIGFSPDSKYVLTTSEDRTAGVWEAASGKLLYSLAAQHGPFTDARFSHNGKLVLTVEEVDTIVNYGISSNATLVNVLKIWDAPTGNLIRYMTLDVKASTIDFSKDDKKILATWGGGLKVYDMATLRPAYELQTAIVTVSPHEKYILTVAPGANTENGLATICGASTGTVFQQGNACSSFKLEEHADHISFNNNEKYILVEHLIDLRDSVIVYEAASGKLLYRLAGFDDWERPAVFSPGGNYILTIHGTVKSWKASNGTLVHTLKADTRFVNAAFSADEKYIVTEDDSAEIKIWDALTGDPVQVLQSKKGYYYSFREIRFSADNKYVIATNRDFMKARIWEVNTGVLVYDADKDNVNTKLRQRSTFEPVCVSTSPDGRYIAVTKYEKASLWNTRQNNFTRLQSVAKEPHASSFSPGGKYMATIYVDSTASIWDVLSGKMIYQIKENRITSTIFSSDGKLATISGGDSTVTIWNVADGKKRYALQSKEQFNSVQFSVDGQQMITAEHRAVKIWRADAGILVKEIPMPGVMLNGQLVSMNPQGTLIITSHGILWDVSEGKELRKIPADTNFNKYGFHSLQNWDFFPGGYACFSPDGKYLAAIHSHNSYKGAMEGIAIVDVETDHLTYLPDTPRVYNSTSLALDVKFSKDGKSIMAVCSDGTLKSWDLLTGKKSSLLINQAYSGATLSPDLKYVVTAAADHTAKVIDAVNGRLLYTFITMDSADYLVIDTAGRYDGTEGARRVLYYVCGREIIELDQLKELFWEPNLANIIMGGNPKQTTLRQPGKLDFCGFTPVVEQQGLRGGSYYFTISGRKGGVGIISLYVGGKQIRKYQPASLKRNGSQYHLVVSQKDIAEYLVIGGENTITVKATTEDNQLYSKGEKVAVAEKRDSVLIIPHLYCISVGICTYKGSALKLNFASQDAADFDKAIAASSRRMLNSDGKEDHVVNYVFNTEESTSPDHWPLKANVRQAFEQIASKATANDILLVFLSGHGVLNDDQFYYLTQEASALDLAGVAKEVAISSDELNAWMRNIKAQKQVLILDACHSGQALQSLIVRKSMPADQQRALEKLRDMTGTYMLSASASNQSALEMGMYNRGMLTYSLLLGMKTGEGLKDKYIDISKWFQFAAEKAKDLTKDASIPQDPQISINGTFPIGIVYEQLSDQIELTIKKPQFRRSNFQNEELFIDDLHLAQTFDKELNELTFVGKDRPFVFFSDATGTDVFSINGRYVTKGKNIKGEIRLFKGTDSILSIPVNTIIDNLPALVQQVMEKIVTEMKLH